MKYHDIENLITEIYLPAVKIERHVRLPLEKYRNENDSEHSYSLALIGSAIAELINLDPGKVSLYAIYHDLLEIYAGDTSVWDEKGYQTKKLREERAIRRIKKDFNNFPLISKIIDNYESLSDEEARFTYALDKLLPLILNLQDNGNFYHHHKITYKMHMEKVREVRPKVSQHPQVLKWYDEVLNYATKNQKKLFYSE